MLKDKLPTVESAIIKKKAVLTMIQAFQIDHIVFMYTPGQIALACVSRAFDLINDKNEIKTKLEPLQYYIGDEASEEVWNKVATIVESLK